MNSVMYSPYEHNMAFACCGQKVLFKKPFNCSHTTFLTSYKSHIFNLSQSKFQRHIIYQVNYKFKFTNSNLPKTKKFGCVGRGDLTCPFFSKVAKY